MTKLLTLLALPVLLFFSNPLSAQERAVTANGDTVVLFNDGRWDYLENFLRGEPQAEDYPLNNTPFSKPSAARRKMELADGAFRIWFDDRKWKRVPAGELSEDADYAFQLLDGDVYGMVIFEELEIPINTLVDIALENAIAVAPNMEVVEREYRLVNGDTVLFMRMDGSLQGMAISYYSYYTSNESGTIQFHTFTGQALVERYRKEMDALLNGLEVQL